MRIPTLCTDYDELMLDLKIYGKLISTPQQSFDEIRQALFEEFKLSEPFPTLERNRYELSRQVSNEYKIKYESEIVLQDNEELVDLTKDATEIKDISFEDLTPLVSSVKSLFVYEEQVTDNLRDSILAQYDLETGEELGIIDVAKTEETFGSVKQDESLIVSDEEFNGMLGVSDEESDYDDDPDSYVDTDSYNEESNTEEYDEEGYDEEEESYEDEEEPYEDEEEPYEDEEESYDEDEEGYDEDEEGYDEDESSTEDEYIIDEDEYEDEDDPDSYEDSSDLEEKLTSAVSNSSENSSSSTFIEHMTGEKIEDNSDDFDISSTFINNIKEKPKVPTKSNASFMPDLDDIDIKVPVVEQEVALKPIEVKPPVQEPTQVPTDLRAFLRSNPNCRVEVALKYFSKKEIEDAIKRGRIIKRNGTLRSM